jgi:hypothetical protein
MSRSPPAHRPPPPPLQSLPASLQRTAPDRAPPFSLGLSASSTFLSQQISHQQPANSTLLSEQTSTRHQPPANRTDCASWPAAPAPRFRWPKFPRHSSGCGDAAHGRARGECVVQAPCVGYPGAAHGTPGAPRAFSPGKTRAVAGGGRFPIGERCTQHRPASAAACSGGTPRPRAISQARFHSPNLEEPESPASPTCTMGLGSGSGSGSGAVTLSVALLSQSCSVPAMLCYSCPGHGANMWPVPSIKPGSYR